MTSLVGRNGSVGIAMRYGLDGVEGRVPVVAMFSAPVHTGPGANTALYTMGTGFYSRG
jgi:hypothetical protein